MVPVDDKDDEMFYMVLIQSGKCIRLMGPGDEYCLATNTD